MNSSDRPRLYTGTSGFSYKAWKGAFYPEDLPDKQMLGNYAERLDTVEINNTFYRMPKAPVLEGWREQVPEDFLFVIKASQRITHRARLKDAEDSVNYLWETLQSLGPTLGPVLFQLPPNFRRDLERLKTFLGALPDGLQPAFEFRHDSWFEDATFDVLREHGAALCSADIDPDEKQDDSTAEPALAEALPVTCDWGYVRLRREHYSDADISTWRRRLLAQPWKRAFVFFKHDGGEAWSPRRALQMAAGSPPA